MGSMSILSDIIATAAVVIMFMAVYGAARILRALLKGSSDSVERLLPVIAAALILIPAFRTLYAQQLALAMFRVTTIFNILYDLTCMAVAVIIALSGICALSSPKTYEKRIDSAVNNRLYCKRYKEVEFKSLYFRISPVMII